MDDNTVDQSLADAIKADYSVADLTLPDATNGDPKLGVISSDTTDSSFDGDVEEAAAAAGAAAAPVEKKKAAAAPPPGCCDGKRKFVYMGIVLIIAILAIVTGVVLMGGDDSSESNASQSGFTGGEGGDNGETSSPSSAPITPTFKPTFGPTLAPSSVEPTTAPSTLKPTGVPSVKPSETPTKAPVTAKPTLGNWHKEAFYVLGDIPYNTKQQELLKGQMTELHTVATGDNAFMTVHVGDMMQASTSACIEYYYRIMKQFLWTGPLPTIAFAGDNDWTRCPDPEKAWSYYTTHFINLADFWLPHSLVVNRDEEHEELFHFVRANILYIGVNIVGGQPLVDGGWDERLALNVEYTKKVVDTYMPQQNPIRGVIMLGHGRYSQFNKPFFDALPPIFLTQPGRDVPFTYIHGDGHQWAIETNFANLHDWPQYVGIQIDQGAVARPIRVDIAPEVEGVTVPLQNENGWQTILGDGLIRIDRRGGPY